MAVEGTVQYRIGTVTALFMLAFAVVADLLQILLTLTGFLALGSDLVTFAAETSLGLWLLIMGVNYFSGKKALANTVTVLATTVVELVPLVDALPTLTIATAVLIRNSRAEDREKFQGA